MFAFQGIQRGDEGLAQSCHHVPLGASWRHKPKPGVGLETLEGFQPPRVTSGRKALRPAVVTASALSLRALTLLVMNADTARRLNTNRLADLIRYAKANPAKLNCCSGGTGGSGFMVLYAPVFRRLSTGLARRRVGAS